MCICKFLTSTAIGCVHVLFQDCCLKVGFRIYRASTCAALQRLTCFQSPLESSFAQKEAEKPVRLEMLPGTNTMSMQQSILC